MSKKPQDRWLIGKTVESLITSRSRCGIRGATWCIEGIRFTDGSAVLLFSNESEEDPYVTHHYVPASGGAR